MKKVLIGIVVVLVAAVAFVATRPADFRIARSTSINAPPEAAFAAINDFHRWNQWSPWDKLDPAMKKTYEGPAAGVGSSYSWVGNDKVGEGKMTLTESQPSSKVGVKLEFIKPFAMTSQVQFDLKPNGTATDVTWSMSGQRDFMGKAFSVVMDMDKQVGPDFEKGLAALKTTAEADAAKAAADKNAQAAAPAP